MIFLAKVAFIMKVIILFCRNLTNKKQLSYFFLLFSETRYFPDFFHRKINHFYIKNETTNT